MVSLHHSRKQFVLLIKQKRGLNNHAVPMSPPLKYLVNGRPPQKPADGWESMDINGEAAKHIINGFKNKTFSFDKFSDLEIWDNHPLNYRLDHHHWTSFVNKCRDKALDEMYGLVSDHSFICDFLFIKAPSYIRLISLTLPTILNQSKKSKRKAKRRGHESSSSSSPSPPPTPARAPRMGAEPSGIVMPQITYGNHFAKPVMLPHYIHQWDHEFHRRITLSIKPLCGYAKTKNIIPIVSPSGKEVTVKMMKPRHMQFPSETQKIYTSGTWRMHSSDGTTSLLQKLSPETSNVAAVVRSINSMHFDGNIQSTDDSYWVQTFILPFAVHHSPQGFKIGRQTFPGMYTLAYKNDVILFIEFVSANADFSSFMSPHRMLRNTSSSSDSGGDDKAAARSVGAMDSDDGGSVSVGDLTHMASKMSIGTKLSTSIPGEVSVTKSKFKWQVDAVKQEALKLKAQERAFHGSVKQVEEHVLANETKMEQMNNMMEQEKAKMEHEKAAVDQEKANMQWQMEQMMREKIEVDEEKAEMQRQMAEMERMRAELEHMHQENQAQAQFLGQNTIDLRNQFVREMMQDTAGVGYEFKEDEVNRHVPTNATCIGAPNNNTPLGGHFVPDGHPAFSRSPDSSISAPAFADDFIRRVDSELVAAARPRRSARSTVSLSGSEKSFKTTKSYPKQTNRKNP